MQENKDKFKESAETAQGFPRLLYQVRIEENVFLEQLSEGLMTASQLARIEKGQRPIGKNMRDRLLGRLGIASDLYENLLNIEDYVSWEQQRNILCAVEKKEIRKAQALITKYEKQNAQPSKDKIKQQFCYVMQAEVLKQQNADWQEIGDCYEKAAKLTIPDIENIHIEGKSLSIQEVNIVLEYEFYHKDRDFIQKCKDLMAYVENSVYDDLSKVKIYPRIVYGYLQEILMGQEKEDSLGICNRAIEMLRNTGRAYYLLELLEIKIKILEGIEKIQESEKLQSALQESIEMAALLKTLCHEYEVPAYMQDCTYLYRQRWMYYVGDVLRIRRKMYGLTQKELCEGICSIRTLRRAEKREVNMQQGVLGTLLRKLGLSKEFQRTRLVTNDREVIMMREQLAAYRNNHEIEKAREIMQQIQKRVSTEIPENKQYFMELEASLDWMEGKITKEEFAARVDAALRCTLDINDLNHADELYLTEMELLCIRNRIQGLADTDKRTSIDIILKFFESYVKRCLLSDCISMYEYVMVCVTGELGNMKEHQSAIKWDKQLLKEELACRRVREISSILYDITWNTNEEMINNGHQMENKEMTNNLMQCIRFSHFCKRTFYEEFFKSKIH